MDAGLGEWKGRALLVVRVLAVVLLLLAFAIGLGGSEIRLPFLIQRHLVGTENRLDFVYGNFVNLVAFRFRGLRPAACSRARVRCLVRELLELVGLCSVHPTGALLGIDRDTHRNHVTARIGKAEAVDRF